MLLDLLDELMCKQTNNENAFTLQLKLMNSVNYILVDTCKTKRLFYCWLLLPVYDPSSAKTFFWLAKKMCLNVIKFSWNDDDDDTSMLFTENWKSFCLNLLSLFSISFVLISSFISSNIVYNGNRASSIDRRFVLKLLVLLLLL